MEKQCRGCLLTLSLQDFYRHPRMGDGRLNYCKDCVKARVAKHRSENLDQIQAYDKWRYRAKPARQAQLLALHQARTPQAKRAHDAVTNAVRSGRLSRPGACSDCGKQCKPEGHHPDYSKPLEVVWLCRSCHCRLHKAAA